MLLSSGDLACKLFVQYIQISNGRHNRCLQHAEVTCKLVSLISSFCLINQDFKLNVKKIN